MARDSDRLSAGFETENTGGLMSGILADEEHLDRRAMWRLGSWGVASVGAVVLALLANQSSVGLRREQVAAAELLRQSQQLASSARENQSEARRLASAVDTLNGDRDRLYSRVTVLEQGLDSVTGTISRQSSATPSATADPPSQGPAPAVSQVTTTQAAAPEKSPSDKPPGAPETGRANVSSMAKDAPAPAAPLMPPRSLMAPPDSAAGKFVDPKSAEPDTRSKPIVVEPIPEVVAAAPAAEEAEAESAAAPSLAVRRTEFGVDVGGANSVAGLRALWRSAVLSSKALSPLQPIIVVKEGINGGAMQLRLVAGPFGDAAAAAKVCAALAATGRKCETTVFDGQRLAVKADEPAAAKPGLRRRSLPKRAVVRDEQAKKPESSLPSLLKRT